MNLNSPITSLPLVGNVYARRLKKLEITKIKDLIYHIPHRYDDFRQVTAINRVQIGETVTIKGKVKSIKNLYTKSRKKIQFAEISDNTGVLDVIWFNQPYLVRNISKGDTIQFSGKVAWFNRKKSLISPEYEKLGRRKKGIHTGRLVPIYPGTSGVSSKWIRGRINYAYPLLKKDIVEYLPNSTLLKYDLIKLPQALYFAHFPQEIEESKKARARLAFNELLFMQLKNAYQKLDWQQHEVIHQLDVKDKLVNDFIKSLPFKLTGSQNQSVQEIVKDLKSNIPMNRLLEGDVGSGKTVVAATASFVAFSNGFQSVFMAPTQILAQQHFNTLKEIFAPFNVRVTLITSSGIKGGPGKTDIFVGTHALIHKKVKFDNAALVVIDEQHRFGVEQRAHLITRTGKKRKAPHVLTMTATPIPRTVALTVYGDLDLSTLDELPKGRKVITTWIVPPQKREGAYQWIEKQIKKDKIQAFVICPLIEESDKETMKQVKAASAQYQKLQQIFPKLNIGLLHGKLKANEKEVVLDKFRKGTIDILCSTPVVEVGIDIANATIMVIETSERFGLAQLHQLRGRVGRGKKKSYCLLFTEARSKKIQARLKALQQNISGFKLAEIDLRLRGPGEILGTKQHGFSELKIASWQDTKLIKDAGNLANNIIENPKKFQKLLKYLNLKKIAPN